MSNKLTAKTQITVDASASKVWQALTKPELIKQYMMGADVSCDWKVGSPIVYTGTYQGKSYKEKGIIQKLEPNKLLQATHFSESSGKEDKPENYALVTWELHEKNAATVVSVSQDNIGNEQGVEASKRNWTMVLQALKKTVEGAAHTA
jgi:uncharacterized protein YndB with AHSA1/START domain